MVSNTYIPQKGDVVWLNFTPQSGKRPAVVLSPIEYNRKAGLMIVCPITSKIKGYPFEVKVDGEKIDGVILSDQVKSLDWKTRNATFIEKISEDILKESQEKLLVLIE